MENYVLAAVVVVACVICGVQAWKKRDLAGLRSSAAVAVIAIGICGALLSIYGYEQREKATAGAAWAIPFLGSPGAEGIMARDAAMSAQERRQSYTVLMYVGGAVAACAVIFLVALGATVVGMGPGSRRDS
jgi:hypothetical protein